MYAVHKLVLPDRKNDFRSKKENEEELKIIWKNNLLNVKCSNCRASDFLKMEKKSKVEVA